MSRKAETLLQTLEPCVAALGYEIVDLDYNPSPKHGLVRIYIDAPDGVLVDDCVKVSHQVSALLDVEDLIPGEYNLEVSSPGVDRVLRTIEHYQRFLNHEVVMKTKRPVDGRRKFSGVVTDAAEDEITLLVDDSPMKFKLNDIDKTRLVPIFGD